MVKTSDCGSDMRGFESHHPPHKKDFGICQGLFYLSDEDENPFEGSSASELRLERFCGCVENTLAKRGIAVKRERARQSPRRQSVKQ